jgi:hypothetical protein
MEPRFIIWQVDKHNFTWWVSSYGGHRTTEVKKLWLRLRQIQKRRGKVITPFFIVRMNIGWSTRARIEPVCETASLLYVLGRAICQSLFICNVQK